MGEFVVFSESAHSYGRFAVSKRSGSSAAVPAPALFTGANASRIWHSPTRPPVQEATSAVSSRRNAVRSAILRSISAMWPLALSCTVSQAAAALLERLSCPLLSGPSTMTVWIKEGTTNAFEEAQARGDYREAA